MKQPAAATNKSLDRALCLLELLATKGTPLNISEISKTLSVNRATAQSFVHSLEAKNYIEKDPETGKYSLGYQMFELGTMYRHQYPFLYAAEKHIVATFMQRSCKINVAVLKPRGTAIILLSKDSSVIPHMVHGHIIPAYASACGKMLLAHLAPDELTAILEHYEFKPFTVNTFTNMDKLREELATIRGNGYSVEMEELVIHRACVAAPIYNISGKVIAAVSFSDTREKIESRMNELIQDIVFLAKTISSELGYNHLNA